MAPNRTNPGFFSDQMIGDLYCTESDLIKNLGFVPFCSNLTHYETKHDTQGLESQANEARSRSSESDSDLVPVDRTCV